MVCAPPWNAQLDNVAALLATVPLPRDTVPSKNVTVPVAFVVPEAGWTVPESCTHCPNGAGFKFEVTVTVVAA